jgi:large subunit ribosomal protein L13
MNKLVKRISDKRDLECYGFFKAPVRKHSETSIDWIRFNCDGMPLGRAASEVAAILLGKRDVKYTDNVRAFGVICENAKKVTLTGKKEENKVFYRHTGYLGGLKEYGYEDLSSSDRMMKTVSGMIKRGFLKRNLHKFIKFEGDI